MSEQEQANTGNSEGRDHTALRVEFAQWLMDPAKRGTQAQWAAAHGVAEFTVSRWKSHPEVVGLLMDWKKHLEPEIGRVAANMVRLASGDGPQAVAAAKLIVDLYGLAAPTKVDVTTRTLADFIGRAKFTDTSASRLA